MRSLLFFYAAIISICSASPTPKGPGKYIIKLKPKSSQNAFLGFVNELGPSPNKIKYRYSPSFFNGLAGEFTEDFIKNAATRPDVEYIELDGKVHAFGIEKNAPSWGLARISNRQKGLTDYVYPDHAGAGVEVYVVDTGVVASHSDFKGRATFATSFVEGEEATDLNGHGTHCAGTVASFTYGVAKEAKVFGVKVLDAEGSGEFSSVIKGIEYVASKCVPGKTVLSMSLGGGVSQAIDDAIENAVKKGVLAVVAAGNESTDSCSVSPARSPFALTVGATDINDNVAEFSNYGKCTKILAPGVDITSLWTGKDGATNKISGTSMATPHVAGLAAVYMSQKNYSSPKEVMDDIIASGTKIGSDLRLVYIKNENSGPTDPTKPTEPTEPTKPTDPTKPEPEPTKPVTSPWSLCYWFGINCDD